MSSVASVLDAPASAPRARSFVAGVAAVVLHASSFWLAGTLVRRVVERAPSSVAITQMVDLAPPSASPSEPVKPPTTAQPTAAMRPIVGRAAATTRRPAPREPDRPVLAKPQPAAAAQAGAMRPVREDVVDFSDTLVSAPGTDFAGGITASAGTATRAAAAAHADGAYSDFSRAPQLVDGARWDCPFPEEADDTGVDHAAVTLRVEVAGDGRVERVAATEDPGRGFGREAERCARNKRWRPGIDHAGHSVVAVAIVRVKFDR